MKLAQREAVALCRADAVTPSSPNAHKPATAQRGACSTCPKCVVLKTQIRKIKMKVENIR